jgi:hypothetical protein
MGKKIKFIVPKGKDATMYRAKKMSHGTYRCKRKPNSPLCQGTI